MREDAQFILYSLLTEKYAFCSLTKQELDPLLRNPLLRYVLLPFDWIDE